MSGVLVARPSSMSPMRMEIISSMDAESPSATLSSRAARRRLLMLTMGESSSTSSR